MNRSEIQLRVLHLEDSPRDHELIREVLDEDGIRCQFRCVKSREDFTASLQQEEFDLILSDFAMPEYDGLSALQTAHDSKPGTPFIFVSGTIGEERAVESLKNGATDYVLKGNLSRLAPVILRALREAKARAERQHAQEALRASEEFARNIIKSSLDMIIAVDRDRNIVEFNEAAQSVFGYTREEVLGQTVDLLYANPEEGQAVNKTTAVQGRCVQEIQNRRKNGEVFTSLLCSSILRDFQGEPMGFMGIARDITEKKNLEAQSLRGQRMESLGTLAGGIAHDLNNVLAPILMSIEILRLKYSVPDAERILATIESSARRGSEMVKQVLTFARGVQGERVVLQAAHLIKEVSKILKQILPKAIQIRTAINGELWPTVGDATQLHQVLLNLCVNARDAMPNGGTLTLEASNLLIDATFAAMNVEAKPGAYVQLSVRDTGSGIPANVLERMFEPFFTTKTLEKGTGLGLSTVLGIVKSHGGFVKVHTEVGKGSDFRVFLPAQESTATGTVEVQQSALPAGSGELVLVVDDEVAILAIAKQTLEAFGYQVITASDGAEAIGMCAQHASEIQVMLTDMMMPVLDGTSAIKGVRRIAPSIKIIATTGLGSQADHTGPNQPTIDAFLQKPYTAELLLRAVHRVLS